MKEWRCPIGCDLILRIEEDKPFHNRLVLGHLYWEHFLSLRQIGELFGVRHRAVWFRMIRTGIGRRTGQEAKLVAWRAGAYKGRDMHVAYMPPRDSKVRAQKISQGLRAFHRGKRIIQRLNEERQQRAQELGMSIENIAEVKLAKRHPTEVGRMWLGIDREAEYEDDATRPD